MTDTTDDAVNPDAPDMELIVNMRGESPERQHTLVPCATCGTGDQPKYMVSVGDDWLCTRCAGAEIGRLRASLRLVMEEAGNIIHPMNGYNAVECRIHRAAFYGLKGIGMPWNKALAMSKPYMPEDDLFGYKPELDPILAALGKEQP